MDAPRDALDKEEFLALSNQKADDWREITRIGASFLGIAGVFITAGLAKGSAWVVILAPLPMFLGVLQMSRNARLQLQLITYLSVYGTGVASLVLAGTLVERDIERIEPERARWEALWNRHKQGQVGMERHDENR